MQYYTRKRSTQTRQSHAAGFIPPIPPAIPVSWRGSAAASGFLITTADVHGGGGRDSEKPLTERQNSVARRPLSNPATLLRHADLAAGPNLGPVLIRKVLMHGPGTGSRLHDALWRLVIAQNCEAGRPWSSIFAPSTRATAGRPLGERWLSSADVMLSKVMDAIQESMRAKITHLSPPCALSHHQSQRLLRTPQSSCTPEGWPAIISGGRPCAIQRYTACFFLGHVAFTMSKIGLFISLIFLPKVSGK